MRTSYIVLWVALLALGISLLSLVLVVALILLK